MRCYMCLAFALFIGASSADGHEFWIEPEAYRLDGDAVILADVRVGQMMGGQSYPFLTDRIVSYTVTDRTGVVPVDGNEGDIPSLSHQPTAPGLHIVAYDAKPERVTFEDFADFAIYLEEEGHDWVIARHRERGLPDSGFTETYTRNARALVQVGPVGPDDRDRATGMAFELIARENPYAASQESLPVTLLWHGKPAANAQIAIFRKTAPDSVERSVLRTDAEGGASVPLAGGGEFLLSAVHLEEVSDDSGAVWHSIWASLTFGLPVTGS